MPFVNRVGFAVIGLALSLGAGAAVADVVAVVSAKTPVTALSKNQVVDIFLGKTSRFPNGEQAVPIDQVEGSAARDEFYTRKSRPTGQRSFSPAGGSHRRKWRTAPN